MESEPPRWALLQLHHSRQLPLLSPAAETKSWAPKDVGLWGADGCFIQLHHQQTLL